MASEARKGERYVEEPESGRTPRATIGAGGGSRSFFSQRCHFCLVGDPSSSRASQASAHPRGTWTCSAWNGCRGTRGDESVRLSFCSLWQSVRHDDSGPLSLCDASPACARAHPPGPRIDPRALWCQQRIDGGADEHRRSGCRATVRSTYPELVSRLLQPRRPCWGAPGWGGGRERHRPIPALSLCGPLLRHLDPLGHAPLTACTDGGTGKGKYLCLSHTGIVGPRTGGFLCGAGGRSYG